jgi:hypothetical protein
MKLQNLIRKTLLVSILLLPLIRSEAHSDTSLIIGSWVVQEWESSLEGLSPLLMQKVKEQELNAVYTFRKDGQFSITQKNSPEQTGQWVQKEHLIILKKSMNKRNDTLNYYLRSDGKLVFNHIFVNKKDSIKYTLLNIKDISFDNYYWEMVDQKPQYKNGGKDSLLSLLDLSMMMALGAGYDTLFRPFGVKLKVGKMGKIEKVDFVMMDAIAINKAVIKEITNALIHTKWIPGKVQGIEVNSFARVAMIPKKSVGKEQDTTQRALEFLINKEAKEMNIDYSIYTDVDEAGMFKGGEDSLQRFMASNFVMPLNAVELGISGMIFIQFVIEKDGSITNIKSISPRDRQLGYGLEAECIRVIKLTSGQWFPATRAGAPVRSYWRFPFEVNNAGF